MKFERDDGTGRPPRNKEQETFAKWIEDNFDGPEVLAGQLPTGVGKSWLAAMVMRKTRATVIVPNNILMDDTYTKVYPSVNFLKGKSHYTCEESQGLSCQDACDVLKKKACEGCPYTAARNKALSGQATFFNPMSLFYLQKDGRYLSPDVIIVDEAHQLKDMLLLISGKQFRHGAWGFPDTESEVEIIQWMDSQSKVLGKLINKHLKDENIDAAKEAIKEYETLNNTLMGLRENSQNYSIHISDGMHRGNAERYLNVIPLEPPRFLIKALLQCKKLILMSATLPRLDVETLIGKGTPYKYIDLPSPIPKENRTIYYNPMPFKVNYKTPPEKIAAHIEAILDQHRGLNTIIHVSYELGRKLKPHFKTAMITHNEQDKKQAFEVFKKEGGVFLASGFAEGVDLKDDLCRVNIVPVINKLNPYAPPVRKRMAWKDGQQWYDVEQIKTLVQQAGRSTRHEKDKSKIIVCDPSFPRLVMGNKADVPNSFLEAIEWRKKG